MSPEEQDDALLRRAADLVYSTCKRVLRDDQDAADCAQDVLARWWRERERIRISVFGWLQASAHGAAVDMIRKREARRRAEARLDRPIAAEERESSAVDECLAKLGEADRGLLIEHHLVGTGQAELARRLRCSQPSVHRRLERAAEKLRKLLKHSGIVPALGIGALVASRANAACPAAIGAKLTGAASALAAPTALSWWGAHAVALCVCASVVVSTMVSAAVLLHQSAVAQVQMEEAYATVVADLQRQGYRIRKESHRPENWSMAAVISTLPDVDEALQQRWWDACQVIAATKHGWWNEPPDQEWITNPAKKKPADFDRLLAEASADIAALDPLLADPRLVIGRAAYLARDFRSGKMESWIDWVRFDRMRQQEGMNAIGVVKLRCICHALAARALLASDTEENLDRLDAFVSACTKCTVYMIEALSAIGLQGIRDDCYFKLAQLGKLSASRADVWENEPSVTARLISQAHRDECMLYNIPFAEGMPQSNAAFDRTEIGADGSVYEFSSGPWTKLMDRITSPWVQRRQVEANLQQIAFARAYGDSQVTDFHFEDKLWEGHWYGLYSNLLGTAQSAVEFESQQMLVRQTVRLLIAARANKPLPETLSIPGERTRYAIRYRKLADDRFEIFADPLAPAPIFADPKRLPAIKSFNWDNPAERGQHSMHQPLRYEITVPMAPPKEEPEETGPNSKS